jgi:hypothetical protein
MVRQRRHGDDAVDHAFEGDRRFTDAGRGDHLGRGLLQAERLELVDVAIEFVGGAVHGVGQADVGDVDDELVGVADVDERVFESHPVGARLQCDREHRREASDHREEGHRRDIAYSAG